MFDRASRSHAEHEHVADTLFAEDLILAPGPAAEALRERLGEVVLVPRRRERPR